MMGPRVLLSLRQRGRWALGKEGKVNYQKVCYTSPALVALDILVIALLFVTVIVRLRHQGLTVHATYWLAAWVDGSDRAFENVALAGLIHVVAISGYFLCASAARKLRPSAERPLNVAIAEDGEITQTPFAGFSA
jgi:hypothetical protein